MKKYLSILSAVSVLLFATPSFAAHRAGAISFSPTLGYMWFSGKTHLKDSALWGFALGYDFSPSLSAQLEASRFYTHRTSRVGGGKTAGGIYTANGLYHFLPGHRFEPFVLAGIGITKINHPSNNDPTTLTHLSAGAGAELFMGNSVSLSMSGRDNYTMSGGKHDLFVNASMNFYLFGQAPVAATPAPTAPMQTSSTPVQTSTNSASTTTSVSAAKAAHSSAYLQLNG